MDEIPIRKKLIGRVRNFTNKINYSQMLVNYDDNKINIQNTDKFILNPQDSFENENDNLKYKNLVIPKLNQYMVKNPRISIRQSRLLSQRIQTQRPQKQIQFQSNLKQKQNPLSVDRMISIKNKQIDKKIEKDIKNNTIYNRKLNNSYQKQYKSIMNYRRKYQSIENQQDKQQLTIPKKNIKFGYFTEQKRLKTLDQKIQKASQICIQSKKFHQYVYTITHNTQLFQIQRIYRGLFIGDKVKINIKIPKLVFMLKNQLKKIGKIQHKFILVLCRQLDIQIQHIIVQKKPKSLFIGDRNKCLFYQQQNVYIGQWIKVKKNKNCKHGIGIQWVPSKQLYFGQFQYNIKKGLGIVKKQLQTFFGFWNNDLKTLKGKNINEDGTVEQINKNSTNKTETQIYKLDKIIYQ